jgi:hypothetical protein
MMSLDPVSDRLMIARKDSANAPLVSAFKVEAHGLLA